MRGREIVARLSGLRVLVVGDVMVDRFIVGKVTRISPEAPVPVVRFQQEYIRLGGAANVAHNLAALGASVALVGVVGADAAAKRLADSLAAAQHLERRARRGRRPADGREGPHRDRSQSAGGAHRLRGGCRRPARRRAEARRSDRASWRRTRKVLLVSDYLKGTITPGVMRALLRPEGVGRAAARRPEDSAPRLLRRRDARHAQPPRSRSGHPPADPQRRRCAGGRDRLSRAARSCESALITRGEQGMWLSSPGAEGRHPVDRARGLRRHRRRRHGRRDAGPRAGGRRHAHRSRLARQPRRRRRRRQVRPSHADGGGADRCN